MRSNSAIAHRSSTEQMLAWRTGHCAQFASGRSSREKLAGRRVRSATGIGIVIMARHFCPSVRSPQWIEMPHAQRDRACRPLPWGKAGRTGAVRTLGRYTPWRQSMPVLAYSSPDADDLVSRLRRVLTTVDLNCRCRTRLEGALDRFTALEHRRQARSAISHVREQRDQIVARLAFLAEIDEVTEQEADVTVFDEVAAIFDEIAAAATDSAKSIRICSFLANRKYKPGLDAGD
jgi:hypothetical protein